MAISLIKNPDERNDPPRPLMEHFCALRDMLIFMATSWAVCFLIAVVFSPQIMSWLKAPVAPYTAESGASATNVVVVAEESVAMTNSVAVTAAVAEPVAEPRVGEAPSVEPTNADMAADAATVPTNTVMRVNDFDGKPRWQLRVEGLDVTSGVTTIITIGVWAGTALSFPFLMFAILRFIFPALTRREKVVIMSILIVGTAMFVGGVALAYTQTLPMIVATFLSVNEWLGLPVETLRIDGYIPLILKTIIAFGLVFQIPLLLFVLGWFGIVSSEMLREKRRWAIVISFILAMVLTPPDPMSQIIMAVPLCLMYEVSVWSVWLKERLSSSRK